MENVFIKKGKFGILCGVLLAPAAWADTYVSLSAGFAKAEDIAFDAPVEHGFDMDNTACVHLAVGKEVDIAFDFRIEAELSYYNLEMTNAYTEDSLGQPISTGEGTATGSGDAFALVGMVNAFVDIPLTDYHPQVELYVGLGVGFARVDGEFLVGDPDTALAVGVFNGADTTMAYQGMIGISWEYDTELSLFAGVRYLGLSDISTGSGSINDIALLSADVGLAFAF